MAYALKQVTIRTINTNDGLSKIAEVWRDVSSGKLPILFDNEQVFQQDTFLIAKYSHYESDESGYYDLSIMGVTADFLNYLEVEASKGLYKKYTETDEKDVSVCANKAWEKVWHDRQTGILTRAYTGDYEISIPAEHSKDGHAHCSLYIALK